jgi:integrase/recombinase XerD
MIVEHSFLPLDSGGSTMFEQLFERRVCLARHQNGPLVEERRRYLTHLSAQGLAHATLRSVAPYLLVIAKMLCLALRPGQRIGRTEIDEQASAWGRRRFHGCKRGSRARRQFIRYATRWLRFLDLLESPVPVASPYGDQVKSFAEYMRQEQGLSPCTIGQRVWIVQDVLSRLGKPLAEIAIRQVDETLLQMIRQGSYARSTVQTYADALRAFFRFAERRNWCCSGLATAIQAPRIFPQESLPVGPSWEQVQGLIAACHGDDPVNLRNHALLLLLAIYGLRSGELVHLQLESFDWNQERLSVRRSKSQQVQNYPLCRTVGDAVLRYLRSARPQTHYREVFLTLRAPVRPLSRVALAAIVTRKLKALGVSLAHYGPHMLRHACATHLLQQGLSLKEIGDHLGHRHPDSTRIYAKVDLVGLRQVADFDLGGLR